MAPANQEPHILPSLTYEFSDLPLRTDVDGIIAALVGGSADIAFDEHGEWFIRTIWIDGFDPKGRHRSVELAPGEWLHIAIFGELEGERFNSSITDRVVSALEADGASIVPMNNEHRLTAREAV